MVAEETHQIETPEASAPALEPTPAHEQIASLAYALWQHRGCPEGSPEEDWLRAEQELLGRSEASSASAV